VLLAPSLRAAVGARWAGCGVLVGLPGDTRRRFLSHPVPPIQECEPRAALPQRNRSGRRLPALLPREHQADAYVRVAAHALAVLAAESAEAIPALPLPRPAIPRFEPPPRDLAAGRAFWQSAGEPEILLHPGVAGVPTKRWPFAHWVALGRSLAAAGRRLAVTAGPGGPEVAEAESLAGTLGVPLAAGGASLPPGAWAAAARLARACVLPDTGLAHLAVAAGAHAVVLFGPSDPRRHAPRGPGRVSVLRSTQDLDCSPCYARRCRNINNHECLRVIEPDAVAASLA
jgi:ADP-heptose:LPS heptosyltransferase